MKVRTLFEYIFRGRNNVFKRNKVSMCKDKGGSRYKGGSHSKDSWKTWRKLSFGLALPMVVVGTLVNILILAMCGETHGPPFVPYEYMYRRVRRFPWGDGDKSFFHNPDVNALPDGYEPGRGPTQRYSDEDEEDEDAIEAELEEDEMCK